MSDAIADNPQSVGAFPDAKAAISRAFGLATLQFVETNSERVSVSTVEERLKCILFNSCFSEMQPKSFNQAQFVR